MSIDLPLYERRRGDCQPLHAYLLLDLESGEWSTACRGVGDGIPVREWHGHVERFPVPPYLTSDGIALVKGDQEVRDRADRLRAGYASVWDGHNHVARLTDDAVEARHTLDERIRVVAEDAPCGHVWDVADWMDASLFWNEGHTLCSLGLIGKITTSTPDQELERMAREIEEGASAEDVYLEGDVGAWLRELRKRCEP